MAIPIDIQTMEREYIMNESNQTTVATGTSLPTLLTVLFIALKLCDIIDWSWWWVLSPIPIVIGIALVAFTAAFGFLHLTK